MLQPATVSSPAPAAGPPASPRTPRHSRKSGIALAIQSQARSSQNQSQPQTQNPAQSGPPQQSTKNSNSRNSSSSNTIALSGASHNGSSNNNSSTNHGRQQRNASQNHARHQSMPTQQRKPAPGSPSGGSKNNNGAGPVTVLKRSSASVVAPTPSVPVPSIPILQIQSQVGNKQRSQQKSRPQSHQSPMHQSSAPTSKSKRTQRRRDIEADTDLLSKADLEAASNQSPPMNPSSPPSSTDSEDSESTAAAHANSQPRSAKGQYARSSGRAPKLSESPPRRPSSAPVMPQLRKGMPPMQRQQNVVPNNNGLHQPSGHSYQKAGYGSSSTQMLDAADAQLRRNPNKANSADRIMLADRVAAEKKSVLYAGPTFHNSPAPTSLPIPAFVSSLGGNFAEPSMPPPIPFFAEAASPQLNSMRPQRSQSETNGGWLAHQSMPGLSTRQDPFFNGHSPLPERMTSSTYTMDSPPALHGPDHLTEISQNLRSLLKIQSQ
ncbi:hypothetical protein EC968_003533 [Mortierella alpina]|nr:hypothetical protein EC968_003533 [Mortierella alpina]